MDSNPTDKEVARTDGIGHLQRDSDIAAQIIELVEKVNEIIDVVNCIMGSEEGPEILGCSAGPLIWPDREWQKVGSIPIPCFMDCFPEITKQIQDLEKSLLAVVDADSTLNQELVRDQAIETLETFKMDMKELQRSFEWYEAK